MGGARGRPDAAMREVMREVWLQVSTGIGSGATNLRLLIWRVHSNMATRVESAINLRLQQRDAS